VILLCMFRQCRWRYYGCVMLADDAPAGLYQCNSCKSLSLGSPSDPRARSGILPTPSSGGGKP